MNHLADTLREQGQLSEAKVWYDRALRGLTLTLGPDHATTLDTVYNLANLLHSQVIWCIPSIIYTVIYNPKIRYM